MATITKKKNLRKIQHLTVRNISEYLNLSSLFNLFVPRNLSKLFCFNVCIYFPTTYQKKKKKKFRLC